MGLKMEIFLVLSRADGALRIKSGGRESIRNHVQSKLWFTGIRCVAT